MGNVAKKITQIGTSEQDFTQNEPLEPWLRQKGEPAAWYMRFKRYLELGPKRSLRKALATEPDTQKATKGTEKKQETRKLSDVSVPGAWKRASKVWRWVERAECYDLAQMKKQAAQIRQLIGLAPHSSRAYRIIKLDYCARLLIDQIKPGIELRWCLAVVKSYQSILHDIDEAMQGLDEAIETECDANAMQTINTEQSAKDGKSIDNLLVAIEHEMERRGMTNSTQEELQ
jgi:hypothetical protein